MNEDDDAQVELEALADEVAGMRIPLLLIGAIGFGWVLLLMLTLAMLGGAVSSLVMMIPLFFVALPLLLFTASGATALQARVDPTKSVLAVNLQLVGWVLLLLQVLGLFGLVVIAGFVSAFFFF